MDTKRNAKKVVGLLLKVFLGLVLVAGLLFGGYAWYLESGYYRIADNVACDVANDQVANAAPLDLNTVYTATTYNVGFGAYEPDYTFFMDKGKMKDGTEKQGVESRARSKQAVLNSTDGVIATEKNAVEMAGATDLKGKLPDFMLFQEIDTDSDRSYHVNQVTMVEKAFLQYASSYAVNFHSRFLMYPVTRPHGAVNGGILTLSDHKILSSDRRSYPIDQSWPTKYFDLDRCFQVSRIAVKGGHELVLINSHMSAYDKGGQSRVKQLKLLMLVMEDEYKKGNYVIAGGDWNHALCGSLEIYPSEQQVPDWVSTLDNNDLPSDFSIVKAQNIASVPTCRGVDIPYKKGVTYTTTVDGFIVSKNVTAKAYNLDTEFAYADHNPVLLEFKLS